MSGRSRGLLARPAALRTGWRVAALSCVVIAVIAVHGCVARWVVDDLVDMDAAAAMPKRMTFVAVRELEPSVPAPVVRPPPAHVAPETEPPSPVAESASAPASTPESPLADTAAASSVAATPASAPDAAAAVVSAATVDMSTDAVASAEIPLAAASAPASAASAAEVAAFAWPESTRVTYGLTGNYRGEIHGSAQVEWIKAGDRYQMHMDIVIGPPFAPLLSRHLASEGTITGNGLVPSRFDEDSKRAFQDRWRLTMRFAPDGIEVVGGRRFPPLRGVQDTVSQFVQLAYLFALQPELLTPGRQIDIPLALPRHVDNWAYLVLSPETLSTPFGPIEAAHLQPRRAAGNGDLSAEIWCAPSLRYLPVRIRIAQDADTYVDLLIDRKPQLAAPGE